VFFVCFVVIFLILDPIPNSPDYGIMGIFIHQKRLVTPHKWLYSWFRNDDMSQQLIVVFILLLVGFGLNSASALTVVYTRHLGEWGGQAVTFILRIILGIPLWCTGLALATEVESISLIQTGLWTKAAGWVLVSIGCAPIIAGLIELGLSTAMYSSSSELVMDGIYAHIRHPIYTGMLFEFVGIFFLSPTLVGLAACLLGLAWVQVQVRLEEFDLVQRLPGYGDYMGKVPRFFPKGLAQSLQRRRQHTTQ
jgi:protein-S-isoprenylcysteine O-methyltransferase Ste14